MGRGRGAGGSTPPALSLPAPAQRLQNLPEGGIVEENAAPAGPEETGETARRNR